MPPRTPIEPYVEDFRLLIIARGNTRKHAADTSKRIRRVITAAGIARLADLTEPNVMRAIGHLRENGLGLESCNHAIRSIKAFARWLHHTAVINANPLLPVRIFNARKDPRHPRRALTPDECRQLLISTIASDVDVRGMSAIERALLYETAVVTGLRSAELRALRVESISRAGIEVDAQDTKNGRAALQPLPPDTLARIRAFAFRRRPGARLFAMPQPSRVVHMLRADLRRAGIPYRDERGRYVDFHALRHTYISWLAGAIDNVRTVQELARHSTITLTIDRYCHVGQAEKQLAVDALPTLRITADNDDARRSA